MTKAVGLDKATLAMGCNFGDLNNDGFLDFYLGTGNPQLSTIVPNRMFLNIEGKEFADISMSGGFGHLQKGHGVSFGDIDNDGDQDVYAVMGGAVSGDNYHNILFKNPGQDQHNHWIKLTLTGKDSNRNAIGTRVSLTLKSPASPATRNIERMVTSGSSFGANPFRLEIGLGDSESVSEIRVFWPASGKTQTFENLQADKAYHISEDSSDIREVPLKSFALKESGTHQPRHNHSLPAAP